MRCHPQSSSSRPFLKWAGSKSRLLPSLLPLLPLRSRLIEPFVGAGSVFLAADFDSFIINDANADLVAVWAALKQRPKAFMEAASAFFDPSFSTAQEYYRIRHEFNVSADRFERAVRLPYLNRFGFNGLYRVNSKGEFNIPFGQPLRPPRFPWYEMAQAAHKLERCTVLSGGYAAAMELAGRGDVLYCDPPYADSASGASFTGYTVAGFSIEDHCNIVRLGRDAAGRGATVLISNHDTPQTRDLYKGFELHEVSARRSLAARGDSRRVAKELIAVLRGRS